MPCFLPPGSTAAAGLPASEAVKSLPARMVQEGQVCLSQGSHPPPSGSSCGARYRKYEAWCGVGVPARHSPEVAQVVEHGLLVERVLGDVHDDGAVHEVAHPIGSPFRVQGEVPVSPANHMVQEVLGQEQGGDKGSTLGPRSWSEGGGWDPLPQPPGGGRYGLSPKERG